MPPCGDGVPGKVEYDTRDENSITAILELAAASGYYPSATYLHTLCYIAFIIAPPFHQVVLRRGFVYMRSLFLFLAVPDHPLVGIIIANTPTTQFPDHSTALRENVTMCVSLFRSLSLSLSPSPSPSLSLSIHM